MPSYFVSSLIFIYLCYLRLWIFVGVEKEKREEISEQREDTDQEYPDFKNYSFDNNHFNGNSVFYVILIVYLYYLIIHLLKFDLCDCLFEKLECI